MPPFLKNDYLCGMKEELTTAMHCELLGKEEKVSDIEIMAVYSLMWKEKSLKKALKEFPDITAEKFKDNIVRVLGYDQEYKPKLFERMGEYIDA